MRWFQLIENLKNFKPKARETSLKLLWILPDGTVHDTVHASHESVACTLFGIPEGRSYRGSKKANQSGWVRVAAFPAEFGADLPPNASKTALRQLEKLISSENYEYPVYYLNDSRFSSSKDAVRYIRKKIATSLGSK